MNKLSPGGWHRGTGNGEGSIFADEGRMKLEEGGTTLYPICKMVKGWDPEEDEVNAQLVAAAPDLLAACETMLSIWEYPGAPRKHSFIINGGEPGKMLVDAINKATGA